MRTWSPGRWCNCGIFVLPDSKIAKRRQASRHGFPQAPQVSLPPEVSVFIHDFLLDDTEKGVLHSVLGLLWLLCPSFPRIQVAGVINVSLFTSLALSLSPFPVLVSSSPWIFFSSLWIKLCMHAQSLQSCLTLCHSMDCNPPGSSVHRISQARILECVVLLSSRGSSQPRYWTYVCSCRLLSRLSSICSFSLSLSLIIKAQSLD